MNKFEWRPSVCAPQKYPVEILRGNFFFENGDSIYIPNERLINNGWGSLGPVHLVGEDKKPIPSLLEIYWLSYFENIFYSGQFDLPKLLISDLFEKGFISPITGAQVTYEYIIVGLAPGGGIAVWLAGEQITTEVCFKQGIVKEIDWKEFCKDQTLTRQNYIQARLEEIMNEDEILNTYNEGVPFGLWEKYRNFYNWKPVIYGHINLMDIYTEYFNAERYFQDLSKDPVYKPLNQTVPNIITLSWINSGTKYSTEFNFDEAEIFKAFDTLNDQIEKSEIILQIEINVFNNKARVVLRNAKYLIEFEKCEISTFGG